MHATRRRPVPSVPSSREICETRAPTRRGPARLLAAAGWYLCITPLSPPVRFNSPLPPQLDEQAIESPSPQPDQFASRLSLVPSRHYRLPLPAAHPICFHYLLPISLASRAFNFRHGGSSSASASASAAAAASADWVTLVARRGGLEKGTPLRFMPLTAFAGIGSCSVTRRDPGLQGPL